MASCLAKNVPLEKRGQFGYGDVWTWTAIDADSKLCVSWLIGTRDLDTAREFQALGVDRVVPLLGSDDPDEARSRIDALAEIATSLGN